jgi:hypothetical protein
MALAELEATFMERFFTDRPATGDPIDLHGEVFVLVRRCYRDGVELQLYQSERARFAAHLVDRDRSGDRTGERDAWGGETPANMGVYDSLSQCVAGVARVWHAWQQWGGRLEDVN